MRKEVPRFDETTDYFRHYETLIHCAGRRISMSQPLDVDVNTTRLVIIYKFGELIADLSKDLREARADEAMQEAVKSYIERVNLHFEDYAKGKAPLWRGPSNPGRYIYCPECRDYREPMDCPDFNPEATCDEGGH